MFSQILGINDKGIAVGYYGDSTTSQHGFIYNTNTGQYTFLDDPSEAFNNGVEVTQITGITNSGEITGFYSDANGVFHGFVANPTWALTVLRVAGAGSPTRPRRAAPAPGPRAIACGRPARAAVQSGASPPRPGPVARAFDIPF